MKNKIITILIISLFFTCAKIEIQPINDIYHNAGLKSVTPPVKAPVFTLRDKNSFRFDVLLDSNKMYLINLE